MRLPRLQSLFSRSSRRRPLRHAQVESLEERMLLAADIAVATQPNIVFIMTDDQDIDSMRYMPRVQELLAAQGITFNNSFVTSPICCPSNVTALTGQYNFNHGVLNNEYPSGGFQKFVELGGEQSTLATWLDAAGYNTARIGKYLVEYPDGSTHVPPGWDEWYSSFGGTGAFFNYTLNENGTLVHYGSADEDYSTDVYTRKAVDFINRAEANDAQPFFLQLTGSAPHGDNVRNGPATPAPRHAGMFAGYQAPRTPSFNEADVSDKPAPIRNFPLLTDAQIAAIDHEYRTRIESLQAVDEGIARIVETLAARGELENTYIVFTSDNGYHLGQHRFLNGKFQVYESDIRVPLIIRGPGVEVGATRDQMVVNIDLAPTMAQWGRAAPTRVMDGQSLIPLLAQSGASQPWRTDFLVELYRHLPPSQNGDVIKAIRTEYEIYVEYRSGAREYYDLRLDPYQLENTYATADPNRIAELSQRLAGLATSHGDPPTIENIIVNEGSSQRSMVTSITVTFDRVVTFDAGAFILTGSDGREIGLNVVASTIGGRTSVVLSFYGADVVAGSLADGHYVLTVRSDRIRDGVGRQLDGDADGNGGGDATESLFRLFGDHDGDRDVDVFDLADFLLTFGRAEGDPLFRDYMDANGDGRVGLIDLLALTRRIGKRLRR